MRRSARNWGILLVLIGGLVLADNLGVLPIAWWALLWPALIILAGVRTVIRGLTGTAAPERLAVPLGSAGAARVSVHHGAGRLTIADGAGSGMLLEGEFGGGVDHREGMRGGMTTADLRSPDDAWYDAWGRDRGLDWYVRLAAVPLELDLELGASENRLDLTRLPVRDLRLQTGASSSEILLPAAAGVTRVRVESGAASVRIVVPAGVAAHITSQAALATVDVNAARFPRLNGAWQSPDYETAANRVDIALEVGVGSVQVY